MKEQIKRKKPEPDHPSPSEKHARRRADEILRAPGCLPRDLDDWLHTERELLAEPKGPAGPGEQARAVGDGGDTETRIRQCACELHLARDGHGHALTLGPPNRGKTSIRTLLVDDSPLVLKILAQILAKEGDFTVVGAAVNGRQALQYAATLSPDLILMDFDMPHLNGAAATRYIKQFADPPTIFMVTSDGNSISRMMSKAAGADAFIVKSGDLHGQLKTKLREWFPNLPLVANSRNPDGQLHRRLVWRVQGDSMEGNPPSCIS